MPGPFVGQVKDVLEHLYDYACLERHPLAAVRAAAGENRIETASQGLRREILELVEALNPGELTSSTIGDFRQYRLLFLHYVEGRTVQAVARSSGLSLRQAYRDLRRARENVAALLWTRYEHALSAERYGFSASPLREEIERLRPHPQSANLRDLLEHARGAVSPMADQRDVSVILDLPPRPISTSADLTMARQVCVALVSCAVQEAAPGEVLLVLVTQDQQGSATAYYRRERGRGRDPAVSHVLTELANRLGLTVTRGHRVDGAASITLTIPLRGTTILVIDDNDEMIYLLERFLAGEQCRVIGVTSAEDGLGMARKLRPDAILLDVMMPQMDGWELLQRLRAAPETASTPVVVCSVIDDPELARALGASVFLPKPIDHTAVLRALRTLGVL